MSLWLRLAVFLVVIGISKAAHHIIRVVILALLGLGGLWMVHTLAQDFQGIYSSFNQGAGLRPKWFSKRSISDEYFNNTSSELQAPDIDWDRVLSRDPASCARSFVCQLAAAPADTLSTEEELIYYFVSYTLQKDTWATKQLQEAINYGEKLSTSEQCRKQYKLCPYSKETMMSFLRILGGT